MKLKGRRQSTNVGTKKDHPTEAYRASGTYSQGLNRTLSKLERRASRSPTNPLEASSKEYMSKVGTKKRTKSTKKGPRSNGR